MVSADLVHAAAFLDIVYADPDLVQAEFEAIVAASWDEPPPRPPRRDRPAPAPAPRLHVGTPAPTAPRPVVDPACRRASPLGGNAGPRDGQATQHARTQPHFDPRGGQRQQPGSLTGHGVAAPDRFSPRRNT